MRVHGRYLRPAWRRRPAQAGGRATTAARPGWGRRRRAQRPARPSGPASGVMSASRCQGQVDDAAGDVLNIAAVARTSRLSASCRLCCWASFFSCAPQTARRTPSSPARTPTARPRPRPPARRTLHRCRCCCQPGAVPSPSPSSCGRPSVVAGDAALAGVVPCRPAQAGRRRRKASARWALPCDHNRYSFI